MANVLSFHDTTLSANPVLGHKSSIYLDGNYLLTSLQSKASILEKLSSQSPSSQHLQMAYHTYCTADTLIGQIQQSFTTESDKVAFNSRARQVFPMAVPLCLQLHESTGEKQYLDKAFLLAERSKASVLSAILTELKAKTFAGIANSLLRQDKQLRTQIADYTQQVA